MISELANGCAFVNEHLTKKNHLTTHMIVSKTPLTPEADNAKFKSNHLGTSVHSNCLSTATTHVEDILPLQKKDLAGRREIFIEPTEMSITSVS